MVALCSRATSQLMHCCRSPSAKARQPAADSMKRSMLYEYSIARLQRALSHPTSAVLSA